MSLIIKGFDTDGYCLHCFFQSEDAYRCLLTGDDIPLYGKGHPESCPLVPLPEKHGRLIDADVMVEGLMKCVKNPPDDDQESRWFYLFAAEIAKSCETIVPAEGGGEDG